MDSDNEDKRTPKEKCDSKASTNDQAGVLMYIIGLCLLIGSCLAKPLHDLASDRAMGRSMPESSGALELLITAVLLFILGALFQIKAEIMRNRFAAL